MSIDVRWRILAAPVQGAGLSALEIGPDSELQLLLEAAGRRDILLRLPVVSEWPEREPMLATGRLRELLGVALERADGIYQAAAALELFTQQVQRFGTTLQQESSSGRVAFLDRERPRLALHPSVESLLSASLGWLVWTWQLDAMLFSATCNPRLTVEIREMVVRQHPRFREVLEPLAFAGDESLLAIYERATDWGGHVVPMRIPASLAASFPPRLSQEQ
jgi:hypothetical protein